MLVLIVVGTLGATAITGGSDSFAELVLTIGIVLTMGYVSDLLEYKFPSFRRVMRHGETYLIRHGKLDRRNMRREMVTEEELMSALRIHGIGRVAEVKSAVMEADGEISILMRADDEPSGKANLADPE